MLTRFVYTLPTQKLEEARYVPTKRSALFWVITQLVVLISYRRFGTTYRSHLQESRIQKFLRGLVGIYQTSRNPHHHTQDMLSFEVSVLRRCSNCRDCSLSCGMSYDRKERVDLRVCRIEACEVIFLNEGN